MAINFSASRQFVVTKSSKNFFSAKDVVLDLEGVERRHGRAHPLLGLLRSRTHRSTKPVALLRKGLLEVIDTTRVKETRKR